VTAGGPGAGGGARPPGGGIVRASLVGTAVFTIVAVGAVVAPVLQLALVIVSVGLFAAGVVTFLLAFARAVERSRHEAIGMGGLFFLVGSAPGAVQVRLLGALAVQVVVAFAAASIRIYTPVAFGLLVPMYGLGLAGLWGSTYGTFGPRRDLPDHDPGSDPVPGAEPDGPPGPASPTP
jgi:hypothetical protein